MVPIVMFYALPLLGLSALNAVAGLSAGAVIWVVFVLAYGAGTYGDIWCSVVGCLGVRKGI